jgi:hypothetical protein
MEDEPGSTTDSQTGLICAQLFREQGLVVARLVALFNRAKTVLNQVGYAYQNT